MVAAFTSKVFTNGALILVLCLLVLQGVSGRCVSGHGCFYENAAQIRKMLQTDLKEKNEVVKASLHGSTGNTAGNRENFVGWELRTVPSGPEPLHHNGGTPKKPRTDP
ncbi:protein CLAVATA 3 [Durio zibethinus]|uniref:Protein CLAVATA 3 n=1 Tax=Durio zibethinus TaxID=66656 RepID=A0A6P5ZLG3_DURZI|nr:protein CLAVATA 3 [Durio zibethinus]